MRDTCFYDGYCGWCQRGVRILRRLDWLGRLEYRDLTATPEAELPVDLDLAMTGMPMRTRGGRVLVGFPAMRRALLQTPLAAPLAALLYLPGLSRLGAWAYRRIALNRPRTCPPQSPARSLSTATGANDSWQVRSPSA